MQPHMQKPAAANCGLPKSDLAGCSIASEHTSSPSPIQESRALVRSVFGRSFVVVHESIGDRFRTRAPSRIRSWKAPA